MLTLKGWDLMHKKRACGFQVSLLSGPVSIERQFTNSLATIDNWLASFHTLFLISSCISSFILFAKFLSTYFLSLPPSLSFSVICTVRNLNVGIEYDMRTNVTRRVTRRTKNSILFSVKSVDTFTRSSVIEEKAWTFTIDKNSLFLFLHFIVNWIFCVDVDSYSLFSPVFGPFAISRETFYFEFMFIARVFPFLASPTCVSYP